MHCHCRCSTQLEAAVEYDHLVRYPLDAAKADKKLAHFYPTVFFVLNAWDLAAFARHQAVLDEFARRIVINNTAWKGAHTWQLLKKNLVELHRGGVLTREQWQRLAKALSRQMEEDAASSSPQSALAAHAPGLDLLGDWPTFAHQTVQQQPIDQHADAATPATEQPGQGGLVLAGLVPQHAGPQQLDIQLPAAPPGAAPTADAQGPAAAAAAALEAGGEDNVALLDRGGIFAYSDEPNWQRAYNGMDQEQGQGGLVIRMLEPSLVPQHAGLQQWGTQFPAAPPGAAPTADAQGPAAAAAAALEAGGEDNVALVDRGGIFASWEDEFDPAMAWQRSYNGMDQEQGQGDEQSLGPEPGQQQGQQQAQHMAQNMAQNMELDAGQEEQPQSPLPTPAQSPPQQQAQEQVQLGQLGPSPEGLREAHLKGLVLQCLARSTAVVVKYRDTLLPECAAWVECNNVEKDNNKAVQQLQQMNQLPAHPGGHLLPP